MSGHSDCRQQQANQMLWDYVVVVTRNSEYHLKGDACLAVRNRNTGEFQLDHEMVGKLWRGCVLRTDPWQAVSVPVLGGALWFVKEGNAFLTSRILGVSRASEEQVALLMSHYQEIPAVTDDPFSDDPSLMLDGDDALEAVLPPTTESAPRRAYFAKGRSDDGAMPVVTCEFHAPGQVLDELLTLPPTTKAASDDRELRFSREDLTVAPVIDAGSDELGELDVALFDASLSTDQDDKTLVDTHR